MPGENNNVNIMHIIMALHMLAPSLQLTEFTCAIIQKEVACHNLCFSVDIRFSYYGLGINTSCDYHR